MRIKICLLGLIALVASYPLAAMGAVACNDANAVAQTYGAPTDPETTSYTRPSGEDFVGFALAGHRVGVTAKTLNAMTWAGNAMTATTTLQWDDPAFGQLFHYIAPPSGAQNVVMDWDTVPLTDSIVIFVCTGANQSTPVHDATSTSGQGTTASTTVSNVTSSDVVIACLTKDDTETMTGGGSLTAIATDNASASEMNTGCWYQPGSAGGSVSITWTGTQQWSLHAAAVAVAASAVSSGGDALWYP